MGENNFKVADFGTHFWPKKEERESLGLNKQELCPHGCGEVRFLREGQRHDPWKGHECRPEVDR